MTCTVLHYLKGEMGWQKICSLKKRQIPQALEDLFHQGMHGCVLKVSFMWCLNLNGVYEYVGQSIFKPLMSYDIRVRAVNTAKNIGNWNFFFPPLWFLPSSWQQISLYTVSILFSSQLLGHGHWTMWFNSWHWVVGHWNYSLAFRAKGFYQFPPNLLVSWNSKIKMLIWTPG